MIVSDVHWQAGSELEYCSSIKSKIFCSGSTEIFCEEDSKANAIEELKIVIEVTKNIAISFLIDFFNDIHPL